MQARISWLLAGMAVLPAALAQPAQASVIRFHGDHVLGTSMDFAVVGADAGAAAKALTAAQAEIGRLDGVLSGWRADSELARLNASIGPTTVSDSLYRVIEACEDWRTRTGGAFSARLGEVEAAWRAAEQSGAAPDAGDLAAMAGRAAAANVRLNPLTRTIDRDGATFAIDGLAKGYIIDAALEAAWTAAPGAAGMMLDIGGDLRCQGVGPGASGWRVGVAGADVADNRRPDQALALSGQGVATSGAGARDRVVAGRGHNHTLCPDTGQPAARATVTVVAGAAAAADALASALAVMPVRDGLALAERSPAVEARIVAADGAVMTTSGWNTLLTPIAFSGAAPGVRGPTLQRSAAAQAPTVSAWPAGFEVDIDYTIPDLSYGRYRPPFVVVWITDEHGALVRTLFHLGNRPRRYLDSNYVWWNAFEAAVDVDRLDSVTRPSRAPGRYTAVWDGRDDDGAPVGQGRYYVNIEMSREHGGHSHQRIPLALGTQPVSGSAAAQTEAGPAAARYGPGAARTPSPAI